MLLFFPFLMPFFSKKKKKKLRSSQANALEKRIYKEKGCHLAPQKT